MCPFVTLNAISKSNIHLAKDPLFLNCNHCSPPADGDPTVTSSKPVIQSIDNWSDDAIHLPTFSPDELHRMTFIHTHDDQDFHAKVIHKVLDCNAQDHQAIKFLLALGDWELEEIISYMSYQTSFQNNSNPTTMAMMLCLASIKSWFTKGHLRRRILYKGSSWNIHVQRDDGTATWERLNEITKFDPVTVSLYGHHHDVLGLPGWHFLQQTAKCQRLMHAKCNNATRCSTKQ